MTEEKNQTCITHHNKLAKPDEIEALVAESLEKMKQAGFKLTKKRREILEYFAEENRYLSALNVHAHMVKTYPTLSYNTTYRNLYDFVKIGLLEGTEYNQEQMFRMACLGETHHHHFICTRCGVTIPLNACPMDHVTTDLSKVQVEWHRFEVFGKCQSCAEKDSKK